MKKIRYVQILIIAGLTLVMSVTSFAEGKPQHPFAPDISQSWSEIDPAVVYPGFEYEGLTPACAACPGCDPQFTFFVKGGNSNNLVIYFQGGGACWDSMNCLYYHTYNEEVLSITEFGDTEGRGIFDTKNPANPFKDWYFVFIPYCTGDIHWGAQDTAYPDYLDMVPGDEWTIQHRGFVNFQVVLQWITDNFTSPLRIFVTGSSAGGYGAIMGFPSISEAFPMSRVSVLGDAANGIIGEDFQNSSIFNWNIQIPTWIPDFQAGYVPGMTMADVYKGIADFYPQSKLAQFTAAWDWNQTFFYYVMLNLYDPGSWGTGWPAVWPDWNAQMRGYAYETALDAPNYRYYIAAGDYHTIMLSPAFYEEDSAGMSFAAWVKAMINTPTGAWARYNGTWQNLEAVDPMPGP